MKIVNRIILGSVVLTMAVGIGYIGGYAVGNREGFVYGLNQSKDIYKIINLEIPMKNCEELPKNVELKTKLGRIEILANKENKCHFDRAFRFIE